MKYLWAALLGLVLSACSSDSVYSGPFNRAAPLPAYPGATDVSYTEDGDDTRVTFFVTASLEDVYSFFHGELTGSGWQRTDLEAEPSETEADYAQGAQVLEFELELDGVFELEVDLGGDNAAYDEDNGSGDDNDNDDGSGDDGSGDDGGDDNSGGDDSGDGSDDGSDDSGDDNPDGSDDGSGDDSSGDDGGRDDSGGSSGDDGGGSDEDDGDDSDDGDGSGDMIGTTTRTLS